jgi:hypothetical protein
LPLEALHMATPIRRLAPIPTGTTRGGFTGCPA